MSSFAFSAIDPIFWPLVTASFFFTNTFATLPYMLIKLFSCLINTIFPKFSVLSVIKATLPEAAAKTGDPGETWKSNQCLDFFVSHY